MTSIIASTNAVRPPATRLPLSALLALGTAVFITALTETLPAGVLPDMSASLGASEAAVGQVVTICAIATALSAIPLSAATATWRRRPLLLLSMGLFAAANSVTALSSDYVLTMVARFVAGVAAGLAWAMIAGYARRLVVPELAGKAIAVVMAGIPLASSLGVPAGVFLARLWHWRAAFLAMSVLTVILIVWIALFVPDQPGVARGHGTGIGATLRRPGLAAVLVVVLLVVLAHTIGYTFIATYLNEAGMGGQVDAVLLAFGIAAMASIWVTGLLIGARLGALMLIATVLVAVAAAGLAMFYCIPALVYLAAVLWGLGWGGIPTLTQVAAGEMAGEALDTAQAMLVTLWNVAMALGGVAGAVVLSAVGVLALPWALVLLLIPALAVVIGSRRGFPFRRTPSGPESGAGTAASTAAGSEPGSEAILG